MKNKLAKIISYIYRKKKIKNNYILFFSHPDFGDNIFPLFLEFKKRGYKCAWILYKVEYYKFYKHLGVKIYNYLKCNRILYMLKFAKYHYFFTSHSMPSKWIWKENQQVFNCWHGAPFKKYRGVNLRNVEKEHYIIPCSSFALQQYLKYYENPIIKERAFPYRHFRTDYFIKNFGLEEKNNAINRFKLNNYSKIIVCCLTWMRNDFTTNNQGYNLLGLKLTSDQFIILNNKLKMFNTLLIIKPHPMFKKRYDFGKFSNIKIILSRDLVRYNVQLYALLALSTALITDFSSILFDYAMLPNKVGHIIHDFDYYINDPNEQFIYDNPSVMMYGYKINNFSDLLNFVELRFEINDNKRKEIAKLYNENYNLDKSSTNKFIEDFLNGHFSNK